MSSGDRFNQAEDKYFRLKGQLATGRITREQFDAALKALMLQDAQGRWWIIGADDSKWYFNDGTRWIQADPYALNVTAAPPMPAPTPNLPPPPVHLSPASPPVPRASGGGCGCRHIGCGCLGLLLLIVVIIGGTYVVLLNGAITPKQLLNLIGQGPANIEISNLRDDAIQVSVTQINPSADASPARYSLSVNAFDTAARPIANAGRYRVDFSARGGANLGTCTLTIRSSDQFQFVALPDKIAIQRVNNPATVGADFVITTSSLCR